MTRTKKTLFVAILGTLMIVILYLAYYSASVRESIIFFPIDEKANFISADTLLTLENNKKDMHYHVDWKIGSTLDQEAYLRQDIGFLFMNGRLMGTMNEWSQKTDQILEEQQIKGKESSLLQSISYHYAEIHNQEEEITSSQIMSSDTLYVIDSNFSPLNSFRKPSNSTEKEWKNIVDKVTSQQLDFAIEQALKESGLQQAHYDVYFLTELSAFNDQPLPSFTKSQTDQIIGNLWEGLYKNYFLGLQKKDGTTINPFGSTIPLILISKDQSHLYVLISTKENNTITLKQIISIP
ncbi:hypothetical protein [Bacillus sp. 2205SS5-2]|uniref:hypothetical protein n=1 Tax=Bacillus sp. 2205SS5-2 TaxID=3109031 RepID=UPI003004C641